MANLSDQQFADLVNKAGASRKLVTGQQVDEGPHRKDQYAVGLGEKFEDKHTSPLLREQVHTHAEKLRAEPALISSDATMQGGWTHKGEAFLDASVQVPGRKEAVSQGRANAQIAVRDLGRSRDIFMKRGAAQEKAAEQPDQRVRGSRATGYRVKKTQPK